MRYSTILLCYALLAVAGCAGAPTRVEDNYGDSVRSMIYNQIADPEADANPDPDPVTGYSGKKAELVLREHNGNVTRPEKVTNEINLNIGSE